MRAQAREILERHVYILGTCEGFGFLYLNSLIISSILLASSYGLGKPVHITTREIVYTAEWTEHYTSVSSPL